MQGRHLTEFPKKPLKYRQYRPVLWSAFVRMPWPLVRAEISDVAPKQYMAWCTLLALRNFEDLPVARTPDPAGGPTHREFMLPDQWCRSRAEQQSVMRGLRALAHKNRKNPAWIRIGDAKVRLLDSIRTVRGRTWVVLDSRILDAIDDCNYAKISLDNLRGYRSLAEKRLYGLAIMHAGWTNKHWSSPFESLQSMCGMTERRRDHAAATIEKGLKKIAGKFVHGRGPQQGHALVFAAQYKAGRLFKYQFSIVPDGMSIAATGRVEWVEIDADGKMPKTRNGHDANPLLDKQWRTVLLRQIRLLSMATRKREKRSPEVIASLKSLLWAMKAKGNKRPKDALAAAAFDNLMRDEEADLQANMRAKEALDERVAWLEAANAKGSNSAAIELANYRAMEDHFKQHGIDPFDVDRAEFFSRIADEHDPKKLAVALESFCPTSDEHRTDADLAERFWSGDYGAGMMLMERYPDGVPEAVMTEDSFLAAFRAAAPRRVLESIERELGRPI